MINSNNITQVRVYGKLPFKKYKTINNNAISEKKGSILFFY